MIKQLLAMLLLLCLLPGVASLEIFGPARSRTRARKYATEAVLNSKLVNREQPTVDKNDQKPSLLSKVRDVLPLETLAKPAAHRVNTAQNIMDDLTELRGDDH